ncbi:hypothetical protein ACIHCV_00420 [Streptomyces sp. NPDC051956]|uniref:hypothetical protein n=1 Tax=Streptomyces sp. NPDC051956 TaxID=3365677 RepID=UPI0037D0AF7E
MAGEARCAYLGCDGKGGSGGLPSSGDEAVTDSYATAQLNGLKAAILATGGITLLSFLVTPHLPAGRQSRPRPQGTGAPADGVTGPTP